jgi:dihydroorotate dehydrogenase (NAD+) catalytic subunit
MGTQTLPDIDSPIERFPPEQLVALGRRVFTVAPEAAEYAPVARDQLDELVAGTALTQEQLALVTRLAAWIKEHRGELYRAYPGPAPPFDHMLGYWSNILKGPRNGVPFPHTNLPVRPTRLFDFTLNFPFGVAACAFMPDARYVAYFAQRGFDLLTYKTVRDRAWNPHPFPNLSFAPAIAAPLTIQDLHRPVFPTPDHGAIADPQLVSLVNSFGVPSLPTEEWMHGVATSKRHLGSGQVLVVSVMGSPEVATTNAELANQFAAAADAAHTAGADIIEVNLSCPNTGKSSPGAQDELICRDADLSLGVLKAVRRQLPSEKLVFIKISYLPHAQLHALVTKCQKLINGVVAINAVPVQAVHRSRIPFFPSRTNNLAGLSGVAIRGLGLETVRTLVELRTAAGATRDDWVIVGVGGVTSPEDFMSYLDLGVDAVQSCSGAWLNHRLALDTRERFGRPQTPAEAHSRIFPGPRADIVGLETIQDEAEARLLAAPAISVEEIRASGRDPGAENLIGLRRGDGRVQIPAFQLDGLGRTRDVVRRINVMLDAVDDPWGVTEWWLAKHAMLGRAPAELLGTGVDDLLVSLVSEELAGDY